MAMIEVKADPTVRELVVFAALWAAFFPGLGWIVAGSGGGILVFAAVASACFVLAAVFNRGLPLRQRLAGAAAPIAAVIVWAALRAMQASGLDAATVRSVLLIAGVAIGLAGSAAVLASRSAGIRLYRAWMLAALPIGWTLSHALLGIVFFGVITPIGLLMRALRRDPMQRQMDPAVASYWMARRQEEDARQYLRQF